MGDIIAEFKIDNLNRPDKKIIYPIALFLIIFFAFLNKRRVTSHQSQH